MKKLISKGMSVIILAVALMSFTSKSPTPSNRNLNYDLGRFQLAIKNLSASLEPNKDFKAYVKLSVRQTRAVVLNDVITVQYVNGQIVSEIFELPLGDYTLEQLTLFPNNNSDQINSSIKIQLPLYFKVTENP